MTSILRGNNVVCGDQCRHSRTDISTIDGISLRSLINNGHEWCAECNYTDALCRVSVKSKPVVMVLMWSL